MRRQAAPHDLAGQAQPVEQLRVVRSDPSRDDLPLEGGAGDFPALELLQDLQQAVGPVHLRSRREVLPAQQEADEVGGRDRLDLAAQAADGQAVDACEDPPVAPLALSRAPVSRRRGGEPAAQHLSLALETRQAGLDEGRRQREPLGHRRRRHRPR